MNDDEFEFLDFGDNEVVEQPQEQTQEEETVINYYTPEEEELTITKDEDEGEDMLEALLRERGITDSDNIKFEGDDGIVRSRRWDDLTGEEQFNILNQSANADPEADLDDNEIDLVNAIRESGLTPQEYLDNYVRQTLETQASQEQPVYQVDTLTDDELFVLDLQATNSDITDDEAAELLANAKANSTLYDKQIQGLRNEYRQLEEDRNNRIQSEQDAQNQAAFNEFSNNVSKEIMNLNSIGSLDINLEDEDQDNLAKFILGRDNAGVSNFSKALNDPQTLTRMAWFALYGEDTFNEINNYMSDQFKRIAQQSYDKGLQEGRSGRSGQRIVVKQQSRNNNKQSSINDLDELDFN